MTLPSASNLHVLLVDDSDADNFLHRRLLLQHLEGCTVSVATSGEEGLAQLQDRCTAGHPQVDLLLLDINMPHMDAWGFLEHYANLEPQARARSLALMESATLPVALRAQATENPLVNHLVGKPIDPAAVALISSIAK